MAQALLVVVPPALWDQLEAAVQKERAVMKEADVMGVTSIVWELSMATLPVAGCH